MPCMGPEPATPAEVTESVKKVLTFLTDDLGLDIKPMCPLFKPEPSKEEQAHYEERLQKLTNLMNEFLWQDACNKF